MENLENPENKEKVENNNQMTKNTLLMIQKTLFVTQKALFVTQKAIFVTQNTLIFNPMTQTSNLMALMATAEKSCHTWLENTILGQLKVEEHQAKCRALLRKFFYHRWL